MPNATKTFDKLTPTKSRIAECSKTFDKLNLAKGKIAEYRYYIRQSGYPVGAIDYNQMRLLDSHAQLRS
ncbi:hypothetical protein [Trichococcus shcherbakoviae]|uniref:hypothetical protein n=1 Tax=Trichococcus shcherbakoviae TaxID=2094020 RepID=UPI0029F51F1B|nr:hypothetical protein [Trichococcus shcherbakoviae]